MTNFTMCENEKCSEKENCKRYVVLKKMPKGLRFGKDCFASVLVNRGNKTPCELYIEIKMERENV